MGDDILAYAEDSAMHPGAISPQVAWEVFDLALHGFREIPGFGVKPKPPEEEAAGAVQKPPTSLRRKSREAEAAAVRIQKVQRGHQLRKSVAEKEKKGLAVTLLDRRKRLQEDLDRWERIGEGKRGRSARMAQMEAEG